jgi:hypothetical protein
MKKIAIGALLVVSILSVLVISNTKTTEEFKISKGINPLEVQQRGCCSWHGGVDGCSSGRVVCKDGSLSPSCTCRSNINPLKGC